MIVTIININVNFIVELLSDKHIGLRYRISITIMDIDKTILRDIHLAFIKMHILYHLCKGGGVWYWFDQGTKAAWIQTESRHSLPDPCQDATIGSFDL